MTRDAGKPILAACLALAAALPLACERPCLAGIPGMDAAGSQPQAEPQQQPAPAETAPAAGNERPAPGEPPAQPEGPASPPAGAQPAVPPELPPVAGEPEESGPPRRHKHPRRIEQVPWPGTFVGARLGMSAGQALVPKYGFGPDSTAVDTVGQFAPYLGTELFYSDKHWGGGVTFEGSFVDLTPSSAWSGLTRHLLAGLELCYIPNRKLRWIFAFSPYSSYKFSFPSGQNLNSRGIGLRAGAHFLLGEPEPSHAWEAFAFLSLDRFVTVEAGTNGQTGSYSPFDLVGNDFYTGMRLLMVGIQYNFAY